MKREPGHLLLLLFCAAAACGQTALSLPERGKPELSLLAGYGYEVHLNRGHTEVQLLMLQPQAAFRLGSRLEWVVEGHLAKYFRPDGFAAGLVPVGVRYFLEGGRLAPYAGMGAGFGWSDLKVEEIDRRFNFILHAGIGVRGTLRADRAWMIEARLLHYSNAGTVQPNLGLNSVVILGGWRFR